MLFISLIAIPMIIGIWAQFKVSSTYKKYSQTQSRSRITGKETAEIMLRQSGVYGIEIVPQKGTLCDHYDPTQKRLVLSDSNFYGSSLAAIGIAAHEAGHAIQDKVGYSALNLRMSLIPITNSACKILPFVIFGGFLFHMTGLIYLGILIYLILTVFQLVTLPVEFDASARAKNSIMELGIIDRSEYSGVKKTLDAAALTYVAAFIAALGNLLYLVGIARDR